MMKKELAAALGISAAMVTKLARRGMPTDTPERAERWRRRHLEPGRVKGVRADTRPGGPAPELATPGAALAGADAIEGQNQAESAGHQGEAPPADFLASRARREAAEAAMAEMRLAEQRGELIRADAVRHALAPVFTQTRDSLMQLPARMAQQLAAEGDPKAVQDLLGREIHHVLTQLASGTPAALRPA
jgi:phage terminase Nu1 subunit (DNA packaging protein)